MPDSMMVSSTRIHAPKDVILENDREHFLSFPLHNRQNDVRGLLRVAEDPIRLFDGVLHALPGFACSRIDIEAGIVRRRDGHANSMTSVENNTGWP